MKKADLLVEFQNAIITDRVVDKFAAAAKEKFPKSYKATSQLVDRVQKVYNMQSAGATINTAATLVDKIRGELKKADVRVLVEYEFKGPDGKKDKSKASLPLRLKELRTSGDSPHNDSGEVMFEFEAVKDMWSRKETIVPIEGLGLWVMWEETPVAQKGCIYATRADSSRPDMEKEIKRIKQWSFDQYGWAWPETK